MKENTCCFLGHRTINETEELKLKLNEIIEKLIVEKQVDTFLFGSKSRFNNLCYELVTEKKENYPWIKRVYIRAEFADIRESYERYLLGLYEETYYDERLRGAGRAVYVKRNYHMIDKSDVCVIYCDEAQFPTVRKSGAKIALDYAVRHQKHVIRFP